MQTAGVMDVRGSSRSVPDAAGEHDGNFLINRGPGELKKLRRQVLPHDRWKKLPYGTVSKFKGKIEIYLLER